MSDQTFVFDEASNKIPNGLSAYPIGSIYMSLNATNPAELFGGSWLPLDEGRVLIGANATYPVNSKGGEASHTLTVKEMPSHNHDDELTSSEHNVQTNHGGKSDTDGSHTHTRGTMEIEGEAGGVLTDSAKSSVQNASNPHIGGAFSFVHKANNTTGLAYNSVSTMANGLQFYASDGWTGETSSSGSHYHYIDLNTSGGGAGHNNMQPYLAVYMWYRTA